MLRYTLLQLKTEIKNDLDLNEENFIDEDELIANINKSVREAEALIHTIYEDYFLDSAPIVLTVGASLFSLPDDIYASKIRSFIYDDGNEKYQVRKIRKFTDIPYIQTNDPYRFLIKNNATAGVKLKLYPVSRIAHSTALTIWYLRKVTALVADDDVCDIPEFVNFVMARAKVVCMEKEGHPNLAEAKNDLLFERQTMIETLTGMIPDEDNEISLDMSSYDEMN